MGLRSNLSSLHDRNLEQIKRVVYTVEDFMYISERYQPIPRCVPWERSEALGPRFQRVLVRTVTIDIPNVEEVIRETRCLVSGERKEARHWC